MDDTTLYTSVLLVISYSIILVLYLQERRQRIALEPYSEILNISKKIQELNTEHEKILRNTEKKRNIIIKKLNDEREKLLSNIEIVRTTYKKKREYLHKLEHEVAVYDDKLAFAEMGVYEPHFDFSDSETFKHAITNIREQQKVLIKSKLAVTCPTDWRLDGSIAKGRTMTNRQVRLTLRAFNNECIAAIANARWNNVNAMEKRIQNAAIQIDKMNVSSNVFIEQNYLNLKLEELFLTHEYREMLKLERDKRAETNRLAREEKQLLREANAAEKEEENYRQMLEKARAEISGVDGQELESLKSKITVLETDLVNASALSKRARSMAEMTRSGFVYIISNIGSFGDGIVKIGLTRRLNPDDRIRELGGASVPFLFDTHAMIYSDDAPALESALHTFFNDRRINAANTRKEFFRVGLDEVESAVLQLAPQAPFFKDREAQEYQETLARRRDQAERLLEKRENTLPESI